MPVTVKKITLWRTEVENRPGVLEGILGPFAAAGVDLQVVMGYRHPGDPARAAVEVYPVSGKKSVAAARSSGLVASAIPSLLVEGDNKPGLAHTIATAIADAGVNTNFLIAQVLGRRYAAVFGFDSDSDAAKAATLIKRTAKGKKR